MRPVELNKLLVCQVCDEGWIPSTVMGISCSWEHVLLHF